MMYRRVMALSVASILAVSGFVACGDEEVSLDPPEIRYGQDISEMGMFVVDPRYTVATLPEKSEEWLLFDDIGELFKYRDVHNDAAFQVMWVNDYHDEDWLPAEDAWYLESTELNSPMGWGVAAFREEADARTMQQDIGGELLKWEDVEERAWIAPPAPMDHEASGMPVSATSEAHVVTDQELLSSAPVCCR